MNASDLKKTLVELIKSKVPIQTSWAVCKSVNWEDKTMVALGISDDLEYNDVLLGLNSISTKPASGSKCLIGLISNNSAASFLIWADEVELFEFNRGENGGLPISSFVKERFNLIESDLNSLKSIFSSWTTTPGDGGAALKSAASIWAGQSLEQTEENQIANPKITQ